MARVHIYTEKSASIIKAAQGFDWRSPSIDGKTVFFQSGDVRLAGVVKGARGNKHLVALAIPDASGVLQVSDTTVEVEPGALEVFNGVSVPRKIKAFSDQITVAPVLEGAGKMVTVYSGDDEAKVIEDYQNVSFAGYASTFKDVTPSDREGDYVIPGAFSDTLAEFTKNPVMLIDHRNSVTCIAGSYSKFGQDSRGLYVQGNVSNCPGMKDVRFLIAEGHLRTLSIGGFLYYDDDGRGIEKVSLMEISLVAVPANPDAIFATRSLSIEDAQKAYRLHKSLTFKKAA